MARLEHMLCHAVTGLSRVLDLGDLTAGEGRDYTPSDTALTQERVLGRVQLCLDLDVALVVSVTLLLLHIHDLFSLHVGLTPRSQGIPKYKIGLGGGKGWEKIGCAVP